MAARKRRLESMKEKRRHEEPRYSHYEFFAGGGMAGIGLGSSWRCTFANDFDERKAKSYRANASAGEEIRVCDVAKVKVHHLPETADLAWASFPCQDLSLAGDGAGLGGDRSRAFWAFWRLVAELKRGQRAPRIVVLENVTGIITSHGGKDLRSIMKAMVGQDYRIGALVVDAVHFLPQSRPRFFLIGVQEDIDLPKLVVQETFDAWWHPRALREFVDTLAPDIRSKWIWWKMHHRTRRNADLSKMVDRSVDPKWHSPEETKSLLALMDKNNAHKVEAAKTAGKAVIGTIYRRMRPNGKSESCQRAEVRFDGIAGCLRTPRGGSSIQTLIEVDGGTVRTRLLTAREGARLMGLPEEYVLPTLHGDAHRLIGDGVAVPVVRYIAQQLLEPILDASKRLGSNRQAANPRHEDNRPDVASL